MMKFFFYLSLIVIINSGVVTVAETKITNSKGECHFFKDTLLKEIGLDYLLYLPENFNAQSNERYPLILFLHGSGERGNDLELVKIHGIPKNLESGFYHDFPFVVVCPQCPSASWWNRESDALNGLLDQIIAELPIDTQRIYLTGMSMGGFGAWDLALKYPHRFAAIAPVCGGGFSFLADRIKHLPVWVFHGAKDMVVPLFYSESMVNALKKQGADVEFTVYPEATHDAWSETYRNPALFEWFLNHRRP